MMTWAYIAGFLDGDGWITHSPNNNCDTIRYTIGFTQKATEKSFMQEIFYFLKKNGIGAYIFDRESKGSINSITKMVNIHVSTREGVLKLTEKVLPFLLIKKQKALDCRKYLVGLKKRRDSGIKYEVAPKRWKEEELKTLKKMASQGYSRGAIAAALKRSIHSVYRKATRIT